MEQWRGGRQSVGVQHLDGPEYHQHDIEKPNFTMHLNDCLRQGGFTHHRKCGPHMDRMPYEKGGGGRGEGKTCS